NRSADATISRIGLLALYPCLGAIQLVPALGDDGLSGSRSLLQDRDGARNAIDLDRVPDVHARIRTSEHGRYAVRVVQDRVIRNGDLLRARGVRPRGDASGPDPDPSGRGGRERDAFEPGP